MSFSLSTFTVEVNGTPIFIALDQQRTAEGRFAQASCMNDRVRNSWQIMMKSYDTSSIDLDATGCPGWSFSYESLPVVLSYAKHPPAAFEYAIEPFTYGALVSVVSASVLFFGFWLIGWLCAGFTRD